MGGCRGWFRAQLGLKLWAVHHHQAFAETLVSVGVQTKHSCVDTTEIVGAFTVNTLVFWFWLRNTNKMVELGSRSLNSAGRGLG